MLRNHLPTYVMLQLKLHTRCLSLFKVHSHQTRIQETVLHHGEVFREAAWISTNDCFNLYPFTTVNAHPSLSIMPKKHFRPSTPWLLHFQTHCPIVYSLNLASLQNANVRFRYFWNTKCCSHAANFLRQKAIERNGLRLNLTALFPQKVARAAASNSTFRFECPAEDAGDAR